MLRWVLVLVAVALTALGCGDEDEMGRDGAKGAFADRAEVACRDADERRTRLEARARSGSGAAARSAAEDVAATFEDLSAKLKTLRPPDPADTTLRAYYAALGQAATLTRIAGEGLDDRGRAYAEQFAGEADAKLDRARGLARRYGIDGCAPRPLELVG